MGKKIILCILSLSALSFANRTNIKLTAGAHTMKNNATTTVSGSSSTSANNTLSKLFEVPSIQNFKEGSFEAGLELESDKTSKFTDAFSFENNLGLESNVTFKDIKVSEPSKFKSLDSYKQNLYITNIVYYQPALKFTFLKDLSLKVGLKVGTGLATLYKVNGTNGAKPAATKPATSKPATSSNNWQFRHENVIGAIVGLNIKNFLLETEFSDRLTIDWSKANISNFANLSEFKNIGSYTTSEYVAKVKLGYSFSK